MELSRQKLPQFKADPYLPLMISKSYFTKPIIILIRYYKKHLLKWVLEDQSPLRIKQNPKIQTSKDSNLSNLHNCKATKNLVINQKHRQVPLYIIKEIKAEFHKQSIILIVKSLQIKIRIILNIASNKIHRPILKRLTQIKTRRVQGMIKMTTIKAQHLSSCSKDLKLRSSKQQEKATIISTMQSDKANTAK